MKKIVVAILFLVIFLFACSKKYTPVAPTTFDSTATPNATQTAIALQTAGLSAQQTATAQIQQTQTALAQQTATSTKTNTPTATCTTTITQTNNTPTLTTTFTQITTVIITPIASYTDLVSVPGGTFTQTDASNTTNAFTSTISAFKMGKYQVTYDLWYKVYTWAVANGYTFANAGAEGSNGTPGAAPTTAKYQPVTSISWREVIVWCNAYSQMTSLTPVYCSDAAFTTPIKSSIDAAYSSSIDPTVGGIDNPYVNWNTNGYRLPTEGEYQYGASYQNETAWTPYNYASGATADYTNATATGLVAWYIGNCSSTQAVGGKTANALGIYDMSGNVWEWCWDWYGTYPGTSTDYRGPSSGSYRVIRGGSFYNYGDYLQVGYRYDYYASGAYNDIGFRFARTN